VDRDDLDDALARLRPELQLDALVEVTLDRPRWRISIPILPLLSFRDRDVFGRCAIRSRGWRDGGGRSSERLSRYVTGQILTINGRQFMP
jgi:hypothetical protein